MGVAWLRVCVGPTQLSIVLNQSFEFGQLLKIHRGRALSVYPRVDGFVTIESSITVNRDNLEILVHHVLVPVRE